MTDADDLALIPRSIRDKLDRVGIKLHLRQWQCFSLEDRRRLRDDPCNSATEVDRYRALVVDLVRLRTGGEADRIG